MPDRCMASGDGTRDYRLRNPVDHRAAVGERYDSQGNPIDRQGNVIAVPAGRSGSTREVFVQEPAFRR